MDDTMHKLGMKRRDLSTAMPADAKSAKEWENELDYPRLRAHGKQAEMLGADELEKDEYVKITFLCKVDRVVRKEVNGKSDPELELCMVEASDMEPVDAPKDEAKPDKAKDDDGDGEEVSPGMAMVLEKAEY